MPNSNCKIDFLTEYFLLFQVQISKNVQLYMKKLSIFSLVSWGIFLFKCILHKTSKIVRHWIRKIILMQTETRICLVSSPLEDN